MQSSSPFSTSCTQRLVSSNYSRISDVLLLTRTTANRSLEDIDAYYRSNPSLIVVGDPDATSRGRPQKYIDHEDAEIEKTAANKGMAQPVETEHVEWTG